MSTGLPAAHDSAAAMQSSPKMPLGSAGEPPVEVVFPARRFSVAEYEQLGRAGILTEDDSVELLEGLIVEKVTKHPPHDGMIDLLVQLLSRVLPLDWYPRAQNVLITSDSAPEPDIVVTRGEPRHYMQRHPTAAEAALVIEVADSSLLRDRRKRKIYARAGISQYWIIDLNSSHIEMFAQPNLAAAEYDQKQIVGLATAVEFALPTGARITLPLDSALQSS
jgi:Uma2 family endonuclease